MNILTQCLIAVLVILLSSSVNAQGCHDGSIMCIEGFLNCAEECADSSSLWDVLRIRKRCIMTTYVPNDATSCKRQCVDRWTYLYRSLFVDEANVSTSAVSRSREFYISKGYCEGFDGDDDEDGA